MYNDKVAKLILITILASAVAFPVLTWSLMQPPTGQIPIKIGLTPMDIYPVKTGDWKITVQFGGYIDGSYTPQLHADYYIATNGKTQLADWTLYGLLQQIMDHDGTSPY